MGSWFFSPRPSHTSGLKIWRSTGWLHCQMPDVMGSVLELFVWCLCIVTDGLKNLTFQRLVTLPDAWCYGISSGTVCLVYLYWLSKTASLTHSIWNGLTRFFLDDFACCSSNQGCKWTKDVSEDFWRILIESCSLPLFSLPPYPALKHKLAQCHKFVIHSCVCRHTNAHPTESSWCAREREREKEREWERVCV